METQSPSLKPQSWKGRALVAVPLLEESEWGFYVFTLACDISDSIKALALPNCV